MEGDLGNIFRLKRVLTYCAILWLGWVNTAAAISEPEEEPIFFTQFLSPAGVRHNPIVAIAQDDRGLMWFGSSLRGISVFDGYRKEEYRWGGAEDNGLESENIQSLMVSTAGHVWVATHREGLYRYHKESERFERFYPADVSFQQLDIQNIAQTRDGSVWVVSEGRGLFQVDTAARALHWVERDGYLQSMVTLKRGMAVAGTKDGLLIMEGANLMTSVPVDFDGYSPSTLAESRQGNLWIGLAGGKILEYSLERGEVVQTIQGVVPASTVVVDLHEDQYGTLWVLTSDRGIYLIPEEGNVQHLQYQPSKPNGLASDECYDIFEDKVGNIWIGTENGVQMYDQYRSKFSEVAYASVEQMEQEGIRYVSGLYEDANGHLWVGTREGYLFSRSKGETKFNSQWLLPATPNGPASRPISAFYPSGEEVLWLGTGTGLYRYHTPTQRLLNRVPLGGDSLQQRVRVIIPWGDEYLLLGTPWGLVKYHVPTGDHRAFRPSQGNWYNRANHITNLFEDEWGKIWVGSYQGLHLFDPVSETFISQDSLGGSLTNLWKEDFVLSIVAHGNALWVGTYNDGLYQIDLAEASRRHYQQIQAKNWSQRDGMVDDVVYAVVPDGLGNLWLPTNDGLSRFYLADSSFENFSMADGLLHNEFNIHANLITQNGEIFFGGINGLNVFTPADLLGQRNLNPPEVRLKEVTILTTSAGRNGHGEHNLERISLHERSKIVLPYHENFLKFSFFSTQYALPSDTQYEYYLDGLDREWIPVLGEPDAVYTNLQPGQYTLKVRAINYDGTIGEPIELLIQIRAPFWTRWWFFGSIFGLMGLVVFGGIVVRARQAKRKQKELEQIILERTRDLQSQKDLIDAQNEELKVSQENLTRLNNSKDFIFSILSHDLRSPLTTLKGFLGLMADSVEVFSKDEIVRLTNKIRQSVGTSLDLIDNILYWSQSQSGRVSYKPQTLLVESIVQQAVDLYRLSAEKKGVTLTSDLVKGYQLHADENMLFFILRNLISNALKFTPKGGVISITTREVKGELVLSVRDSGIGISEEVLDKIFNPNQAFTTRGTANEKGTGLGLKLVQQFVKVHQGSLKVNSDPGEGSEFIIALPTVEQPEPAETQGFI